VKVLLFGKNGQLGWELHRALATLGDVQAMDYPEVDFTSTDRVRDAVRKAAPRVIVNAAAYTAVDRAESEPGTAMAVNAAAPGVIAEESATLGAALIHFSTDYVFDGKKGEPYSENDTPNPLNMYGKSKLAGEKAVEQAGRVFLVIRTSLMYSLRRECFVTSVLKWAREQTTLRIVADQVSNPTWCRMLAEATAQLVAAGGRDSVAWLHERSGLYHLAGDGFVSRFDWAQEIVRCDPHREEQIVQRMEPASTVEFPAPAERPLFSALNCSRFYDTFGIRLPDWRHALHLAIEGK